MNRLAVMAIALATISACAPVPAADPQASFGSGTSVHDPAKYSGEISNGDEDRLVLDLRPGDFISFNSAGGKSNVAQVMARRIRASGATVVVEAGDCLQLGLCVFPDRR